MSLDDLPAQIQTDARAAHPLTFLAAMMLNAEEFLEDSLAERGRDARTRIRRLNPQPCQSVLVRIRSNGQAHLDLAAGGGVLEGVVQQIDEDDAQAGSAAAHQGRRCLVDDPQANGRILEARPRRTRRLFHQGIEIDTFALQTQLPRLDARQIEQLVDGCRQLLG